MNQNNEIEHSIKDFLLRIGLIDIYVHDDPKTGSIVNRAAEVLVSSEGTDGSMMGAVSSAIKKKGGGSIHDSLSAHRPLALGDVIITGAGKLSPPVKFIYHAIVVGWGEEKRVLQATVYRAIVRCMELAQGIGIHSIAFPSLGTGISGRAEHYETHSTMSSAFLDSIRPSGSLRKVHFCFIDPNIGNSFRRAFLKQRLVRQAPDMVVSDRAEENQLNQNLDKLGVELSDLNTNVGQLIRVFQLMEANPSKQPQIINRYIYTGGGAYFEDEVQTGGGAIIGRDQVDSSSE